MYPYKIRINDPELVSAFKKISKYGYANVKPSNARRIGQLIPRKIKKDGVIIKDGTIGILNKKIVLDFKPNNSKRKGFDFEFKTVFNKFL